MPSVPRWSSTASLSCMPDSLNATPLLTRSLKDFPEYSTTDSLVVSPAKHAKSPHGQSQVFVYSSLQQAFDVLSNRQLFNQERTEWSSCRNSRMLLYSSKQDLHSMIRLSIIGPVVYLLGSKAFWRVCLRTNSHMCVARDVTIAWPRPTLLASWQAYMGHHEAMTPHGLQSKTLLGS